MFECDPAAPSEVSHLTLLGLFWNAFEMCHSYTHTSHRLVSLGIADGVLGGSEREWIRSRHIDYTDEIFKERIIFSPLQTKFSFLKKYLR